MERAKEAEVENVYFIDGDAAELSKYFDEGEVNRLFLNFSDPWPSQPGMRSGG